MAGGAVGAGPEAVAGAGAAAVDVTAEDDGASGRSPCQQRGELGALRVVPGHLGGGAGVQVGGADVDVAPGGDTQPPAPLDPRLGHEGTSVGAPDGGLGEHRVTEAPASAGSDAEQRPAAIWHRG